MNIVGLKLDGIAEIWMVGKTDKTNFEIGYIQNEETSLTFQCRYPLPPCKAFVLPSRKAAVQSIAGEEEFHVLRQSVDI